MAEQVIISFETGEALTSIKALEAELKKVKSEFKGAEIGSAAFYKAQESGKVLTAEIKKQNDALKANSNALGGINSSAKFATGSYGKLKQQIKDSRSELDKYKIGSVQYNKVEAELIDLQKQRIAVETKMPSLFQERIKLGVAEITTTKELREAIKATMSDVIAGVEGSAEKLAELKDKLNDIADETKTLAGSGVERLTASMGTLTESIKNFDADKMKIGLKGIGGAMRAIPIFLILEGLKLLIENFDKIFAFAQSFTDVAKEAKKLSLEQDKLTIATAKATAALNLQIAKQEAAIAIMEAEGKSLRDIEAEENKVRDAKLETIKIRGIELKGAAESARAKKREIDLNETLEMSAIRMVGAIGGESTAKAASIIIAKKKAEASVEFDKIIADSMKGLSELEADVIGISTDRKTTRINNSKEITRATLDDNRQIKQSEIDLTKDEFERANKQAIFNAENRKEDLALLERFYGDKGKLAANITKLQDLELEKINRDSNKRREDLANELSQFKIDLILNDFEREQEQIKLNEKAALEEAVITYADNAEQFQEVKKAIIAKYAEENRLLALDYVTRDMEAEAELQVLKATSYDEQFAARTEQLALQHQTEMANKDLTEQEKALLDAKYKKDEIIREEELLQQKKAVRDAEISIVSSAFSTINNLAILFTNDQKELAKLSKIASLISIGTNTATAISNLMAVSFSPLDPANAATGGLAAYAKIAAGVVTISQNAMQAKAIVNSFEEGGYTGDGAANEVSTNLGAKSYTYHKSEYVIPARVLGTPQGNMLAAQAESMRLGMSNPMPYIGGMFDGGFTARSAGANANSQVDNRNMMQGLLMNLPTPVVRVTDINKVQGDTDRALKVSSL